MHFGLALTGLVVWISFLATGVTGLAWAACGLLLPVAGLGMSLVFLAPDRRASTSLTVVPAVRTDPAGATTTAVRARSGDRPRTGRLSVLVVAVHIVAACITILLAVLAAVGPG